MILSTNSNPVCVLGIGHRLDLDVAVAELAAAAGLLLVSPVRLGRPADRLLVGHARRLERDVGAEPGVEPIDDHFDVHLGQPGDDLLPGLRIAMQVDRRVLLLQAAQRREDLVLVALVLRLDREGHHRGRKLDARHLDRLVAGRQPVARARLAQLGDRADVAGAELVGVLGLLAAEQDQLPDAFLDVRPGVQHLAVGPQDPLVDPKQVDAPGERIGPRLEHVREQLAILAGHELDVARLQRAVLDRRGEILHDRVQQAVGAEVARGDTAHHREDVPVIGALLEGVDDLGVGDVLALQIALHQRLGHLGHLVHQLLAVLLRLCGELLRDRDLAGVASPVAVVLERLHVDEVDDAPDLVLAADRDLGGHDVLAEGGLQLLQRAEEVGPLAVEHVHEHQPRQVELGGARPQARRADLDAHHRVDDEHGRLADPQGPEGVGHEARLTGGVDEVDLAVLPPEGAERGRDRHLARLLVGVGIGHGATLDDRSETVDHAGLEQERLVQGRLAGAAMADQSDVADTVRSWTHACLLSLGVLSTIPAGRCPCTTFGRDHEPGRRPRGDLAGPVPSRPPQAKESLCMRERSRSTALVCSWEMRDSVTPSTSPISRRVRFS